MELVQLCVLYEDMELTFAHIGAILYNSSQYSS